MTAFRPVWQTLGPPTKKLIDRVKQTRLEISGGEPHVHRSIPADIVTASADTGLIPTSAPQRRKPRPTGWPRRAALAVGSGCSLKKMAINQVGNALASGGSTHESDDDPDLVPAAIPFA